jgi:hypothetical protein
MKLIDKVRDGSRRRFASRRSVTADLGELLLESSLFSYLPRPWPRPSPRWTLRTRVRELAVIGLSGTKPLKGHQ